MKKAMPMSILWTFFLIPFYTLFAQIPQYCASKGTFPWEQWMERVSISSGNFGNSSGKEGYGDFTSLAGATLKRNTGNLITISPKSSWNGDPRNANMFWRVWVDFNGDGDFTDAGETVISRQVVIQSQTFLDNEAAFTPPQSARLGKTRLRVAMKAGGYPDPCETFERGEVEDYTVDILDDNSNGTPDLIPENINSAASFNLNQQQNMSFSVHNNGSATSTSTSALIYLSKDNQLSVDDVLLSNNFLNALAPNASVSINASINIGLTWTYEKAFLIVKIDPLSIESNKLNNTIFKTVNINLPPLPSCVKPLGSGQILCNYDDGGQNVTVYIAENNMLIRKELDRDGNILSTDISESLVRDSVLVKNNQVIKKLANGSIAYSKNILPSVLNRVSSINSVVELTDGTFVLAGFQKTFSNDPNPNLTMDKLVLVTTDANLEYQSETIEANNSGFSNVTRDSILQIIPWINNQFIILYYYGTSFAINSQNFVLSKYQKNGATLQKIKSVTDGQKLLQPPFLTFFCGDNLMIFSTTESVSIKSSFIGQNFISYTMDSLFPVIVREIGNGSTSNYGSFSKYSYLFRPSLKESEYSLSADFAGDPRFDLSQLKIQFYYNSNTSYYSKTIPFVQYDHVVRSSDTTCLILGTRNGQLWSYNPDCNNVPPLLPDLILGNLTLATPTVQQGQVLNFSVDIKNLSTANATGNFTVKAYISKDNVLSGDDIQNGVVTTGNFPAGFSVTQVLGASTIPTTLPIGQYFLILKVDADNQIAESNEFNNEIISSTSFSVTLAQSNNQYCASKGLAPWELWVSKVQFNTINNESEKFKDYATLGYSDYSNLSTGISKGQTYLLNITPGLSWSGYLPNVYCRAWIDYNGNKIFENAELVFQNINVNPFSANIRVPSSAINGNVRMRVALKWGGYPEPCEIFARGEVEDYTLNIIGQSLGSDTLRLVAVTGANAVRQGEKITLNVSIKNTGSAPSNPNTPLSIYQNQQPFIFKGPPPTFLTIASEQTPIGRAIQPNETVTLPVTFTMYPNFSHITRPDYSGVQYVSTYVVIGNRSNSFIFYPYSYPVLDTLALPYNISAILDNSDLAINIIALDTTFNKNGKHSFTVKVTNNGSVAAKDVIANVGTAYSQYATGIFTSPTVTPQRGTVFSNTPFGGATYVLWNINSLAPNESLTALVQYDKFAIPAVLPEFRQEVRVGTNQIIDTMPANNTASQRFVLDTTPLPYCVSKGIAPWEQWISSVSLASRFFLRQYPATAKEGYGNFTALQPADIVRGETAFLTISPTSSWNNDPRNDNMFWRAWMDWNDDGDFDDSGEFLYGNKVVFYLGVFFDNGGGFFVPSSSSLGRHRLRIAMKVGGYPSPCETFERGEVEDYMVNVVVENNSAVQPLIVHGDLRAVVFDNKIRIDWVRQSSNIASFDIEKSVDGNHFDRIAIVPTAINNYHVAYDDSPTEGGSFYRLKMHLMNGEMRLTAPEKVHYEKLVDFTVFPNPAADEAYIDLKKYEGRAVNILLSDVAGQIISSRIIEKATSAPLRLDLTPFKNGTYFIVIKSNNKRDVLRKLQILKY